MIFIPCGLCIFHPKMVKLRLLQIAFAIAALCLVLFVANNIPFDSYSQMKSVQELETRITSLQQKLQVETENSRQLSDGMKEYSRLSKAAKARVELVEQQLRYSARLHDADAVTISNLRRQVKEAPIKGKTVAASPSPTASLVRPSAALIPEPQFAVFMVPTPLSPTARAVCEGPCCAKPYPAPDSNASRVLLCISSCNQLDLTERMLLKSTWTNNTDVIIVDDASEQEVTAAVEQRFCTPVLRSEEPMGLSYHWNKCYQLHLEWGYAAAIISNNDVVVPRGALAEFNTLLLGEAPAHVKWLAPTTSAAGVRGGHRGQQVSQLYKSNFPQHLRGYHIPMADTQDVQDALEAVGHNAPNAPPRVMISNNGRNDEETMGFFFGLRNLTHGDGITRLPELLSPSYKNTGQESHFQHAITKAYVATRVYVFHRQGGTLVFALNGTNVDRNDKMLCHGVNTMPSRSSALEG